MNSLQLPLYRDIFHRANWQTDQHELPIFIREWLGYTASLTVKLQQICPSLAVEITQQGWQQSDLLTKNAEISGEQTAWLREVVLKCDTTPIIFAQTIFFEQTIKNVAQEVLALGERPIGLWLFPQFPQRINLEWAFDDQSGLYARRSYFTLKGYPFTIYELFLPHFPFKPLNETM